MKTSVNTAIFVERLNNGESQINCLKDLTKIKNLIDNIQVRGEFFDEKTKDKELEEIKKLCQENGWGLYYSVPEEFFKNGKINSSFKENLEMSKKHQINHLKYFIGDSTGVAKSEIQKIDNQLKNSDIDLTLENLSNNTGDLTHVEAGLKAIQEMKNIGFTYDAGNWYWVDENPTNAFNRLKSQITNFHLKDIKDKETVMLGEGTTDWKPMVRQLSDDIPIFLEYGIPTRKIADQIKLVNSVIDKR